RKCRRRSDAGTDDEIPRNSNNVVRLAQFEYALVHNRVSGVRVFIGVTEHERAWSGFGQGARSADKAIHEQGADTVDGRIRGQVQARINGWKGCSHHDPRWDQKRAIAHVSCSANGNGFLDGGPKG